MTLIASMLTSQSIVYLFFKICIVRTLHVHLVVSILARFLYVSRLLLGIGLG